MSMESVDVAPAPLDGDRRRERSLEPVIDRLEFECGDTLYFILEATGETVIPHVYDGGQVRNGSVPDQDTLTHLCQRLDQYFLERETLTSNGSDDAEHPAYLTTWAREMKVVRLAVPEAEFFIGLAHERPVVPIVDGICQALAVRREGERGRDRPVLRPRRTEV